MIDIKTDIFVTGTDTDIGKTYCSGVLANELKYEYWKPIQTGVTKEEDFDSCYIRKTHNIRTHSESYCFSAPLSPHIAANLENQTIDINNIKRPDTKNNLIIEGAGGVLVPINEQILMIDLIKHFNIPVIIVAADKLGTINHTLMTIEMLRKYQIEIIGVIMNFYQNEQNAISIEKYGRVKIVHRIPIKPLKSSNIILELLSYSNQHLVRSV